MMKHIGLAALAASAVAITFIACGDGPTGGITCASDAECTGNELCHPTAGVCVEKCTTAGGATDCPQYARTCAKISDTNSQEICQCSTDQLCAQGPAGAGSVCQQAFKVCAPACASNTDCPTGFDCDTATGQCNAAGNTCTPACAANETCDTSGATPTCKPTATSCTPACAAHETCDTSGATPTCKAATCTASDPQPSSCAYGTICSGSSCAPVPSPTCGNFVGSSHGTSWSPTQANKGPVIHAITKDSYQAMAAFCGGTLNRYKVKVEAYDPAGGFPSGANCTNSGAPAGANETAVANKLHRVDASGNEITMGGVQCVNTTNGGKNVTFFVNFCAMSSTGYTAALHFENGNEFCTTVSAN
jgi:hypothetical protein